ncbi:MAG TPA: iron ABC transporter permease [Planctomycetes bacterium]|nr:iron ABC transporter permease [Planctomycetota bacterium]
MGARPPEWAAGEVQPHRSARVLALVALVSFLIVSAATLIQIGAGSYDMTWREAWAALSDPALWRDPSVILRLFLGEGAADRLGCCTPEAIPTATLIVWTVRMPRVLVGILVGVNLAFSGCIFQAITRNEMASPYLLGVSSGAGLTILVVLVIYPHLGVHLPLLAMVGGMVAFVLVYAIAWNHGTSPVRLVLAGVIVGAVAGSIQTALHYLVTDITVVQDALAWTSGSLVGVGWAQVRMIAPWTVLCVTLGLSGARYLDVLLLGDETAKALGMSIERARFLLASAAVLSAASAVSVAGLIGFVGLIVPHIVRSLVGSPHHRLLVGCLLAGPALLVGADAAARLVLNPLQVPVGLVLGVLGGGFFLYLMRRKRDFGRL